MTDAPLFLEPEPLTETGTQVVPARSVAVLAEQLRQQDNTIELLMERLEDTAQAGGVSESLALAELSLEDVGWRKLTAEGDVAFSRAGLVRAAAVARAMSVTNALLGRGVALRVAYVWGSGVQVSSKAVSDEDGQQDVNAVIQRFWDDPGNKRAISGEQAQEENERALATDGEVYLAAFTRPVTGSVQVRVLPGEQITRIITNPEDTSEPWFYERTWIRKDLDYSTGATETVSQVDVYPAIGYRPAVRPAALGRAQIHWDSPVLHVSVNRLQGWQHGIGDLYTALPWGRAYSEFLQDWAGLVKALSKIAFQQTAKGSKVQQLAAQQRAVAQRALPGGPEGAGANGPAGQTMVSSPDVRLEAVSKSGASIDSDSGRPLAAMVAAALDVPVTILLGDPGVTGARATAETLDEPTKLAMRARRRRWTEAIQALCAHVIREAVRATQGPLLGTIRRDEFGREQVLLAGETDATVDVTWPDLDKADPKDILAKVQAIVAADQTQKLPPLEVARLLLLALGAEDVDSVLGDLTDDDGNFVDPEVSAGLAAMTAHRAGADPAAAVYDQPPAVGKEPAPATT